MREPVACPACGRRFFADLGLDREERRKEEGAGFFPFCSERCRALDLGRFLDEEYRVSEPLLPGPDVGVGLDDR